MASASRQRRQTPKALPRPPQSVLVVEDDDETRAMYRAGLEHAGYRVMEATDGTAALERARVDQADLVLMDAGLPGLDGWEATRTLKAEPGTRHIPVIAVTAHTRPADRLKAVGVGCDAYLAKPVEPRAIAVAVRRLIGPPGAPRAPDRRAS